LILGAFLRFQGVEERGPSFFDDGIYTLEGRWIRSFAAALTEALARKIEETRFGRNLYTFEEEKERFQERLEGEPPVWGRPGFSLLTAICVGLVGPEPYATGLVSAFFGTLSLLGIFLLGRALYDEKVGLFASFLLSVSGYHLVYSITGFADGPAMCFAVFAIYFYQRSLANDERGPRSLWVLFTGFTVGLAFTVHDRFLYLLLVIFVNEGLDLLRRRERAVPVLKRTLVMGAAFLFPLFLFELPYYLGMLVLRHFNEALPFRTYFEELFTHHIFNLFDAFVFPAMDLGNHPEFREAGSRLWNLLTYPYLFLKLNGPVFCLLFLGGLAVGFARRRDEDRLLAVWFFLPFFLFSIGLAVSVRYALVFLPAATLMAARSLWLFTKALERTRISGSGKQTALALLLVLLTAGSGFHASREIRAMRCSYQIPARFLLEHGKKHVSLQHPVSKAYLGTENAVELPHTPEGLRQAYEDGYRYILIDYRKFFLMEPFDRTGRGRMIQDIETAVEPDFCHSHPCYIAPCYLFEINLFFRLTLKLVREAQQMGVDRICIYDLGKYYGEDG